MSKHVLRVPAIEVRQGDQRVLYSFAIDGKSVPTFAAVSRVRRADGQLEGYQRPEVLSHISEIRQYLESAGPMIPNAIVLAFDKRVSFAPSPNGAAHPEYLRVGTLSIPVDPNLGDSQKPGFVVDGQQRLAAIRDASVQSFPVCVTAFLTESVAEQIEQFILVNSTKPLPKGLIYELLPGTIARLPTLLERRRFPAHLLDQLNYAETSPLKGMIQTPTTTTGVIKDTSILRLIENSLSDGLLYRFRDPRTGRGEVDQMLLGLQNFWSAVRRVFPTAWGLPPRRSRLMHGAGVVSLGLLMDAISERKRSVGVPTQDDFAEDLLPLAGMCRWTDGYWDFGPGQKRRWNEIQNTSKDIQLLSNFLLVQYKALVWNRAPAGMADQQFSQDTSAN